jgi:hypothetical protein
VRCDTRAKQSQHLYLARLGTVVLGVLWKGVRGISSVEDREAALMWLVSGLEHVRARGQTRILGYLEAVLDDVVFEMESAARSGSVFAGTEQLERRRRK